MAWNDIANEIRANENARIDALEARIAKLEEENEYAAGLLEISARETDQAKTLLRQAVEWIHGIMRDRLDYTQAEITSELRQYREFLDPTGQTDDRIP